MSLAHIRDQSQTPLRQAASRGAVTASEPDKTHLEHPAEPLIRVLHVFAPASYGGAEQVVTSLSSEQVRAGHNVAVAAILDQGVKKHPVVLALRDRGVIVREFRLPHRGYRRERAMVRELVQEVSPHVVHTHGYRADVLHGRVARRQGAALVATVHGFIGGGWKNRFYEWLQRRAYRHYDAVVAVSEPLVSDLAEGPVPRSHLYCIPNAWVGGTSFLARSEARRLLGLDGGRPWVGFVGRLGPEKGPDVFVDAIDLLGGAANAVMIGDGRLRRELAERGRTARDAGDTGKSSLHFSGMVPEAARYMKALDVFVLSSRTEGTPMALLEAIAAGVPVVATRVGGVPDVVSDEEAILVEPERPRELAAAIQRVLADPAAARDRAERAHQRLVDELGPDRWVARYDEVYRAAISGRGG